jgi:hypothetical protein
MTHNMPTDPNWSAALQLQPGHISEQGNSIPVTQTVPMDLTALQMYSLRTN